MRLKAKLLNIETGGPFIVVLNPKAAEDLDVKPNDRVRVMSENKYCVAIVNVSSKLKHDEIGVFEEVRAMLNLDADQPITIIPEESPYSILAIRKKLEGLELTKDEIYEIVTDIVDNRLTKAEIASFVTGIYTRRLSMDEIEHLTKAITETGQTLKLDVKPVLDIHSIGGVPGNRITMIVVPIVAAAGLYIPKTSSRAITDPAGTADTMEVLAPVSFKLDDVKNLVLEHKGCVVWGGALDIAPADDIIIEIERPLQIDPTEMLLSSILAKKRALGITNLVLEIPYGPGTKCTRLRASELEKKFLMLCSRLDISIKSVKIDGSQPVGNGIGPALECIDVLKVLENAKDAPQDLKNKALYFASLLLEEGKKAAKGKGLKLAKEILNSGKALEKFKEIIRAQGGNPNIASNKIQIGKYDETICAEKTGVIQAIDNELVKRLGRFLGAPFNKGAGVLLKAKVGDEVKEGDPLFTIYAESGFKLSNGLTFVEANNPYKIKERK
ncbi:MAG: AMP phosphorylase [Candidatus Nanoarchaeia archaeon]